MCPNLEGQVPDISEIDPKPEDIHLNLTPLSDLSASTSLSEASQSSESESHRPVITLDQNMEVDVDIAPVFASFVPLEHNIRELLLHPVQVRTSDTENLETVTQIKLRVIARELALQQLGIHLPSLRELVLDGSIISSLRDLGHGLRSLKILRVNRCRLSCIDGVLGFESLEELHAADNSIKDLSPCAFLSNLKVLDIRRNSLRNFGSVSFLNLCPLLAEISIEGNEVTERYPDFIRILGAMLENLSKVDGEPLTRDSRSESRAEGVTEILLESSSDSDESVVATEAFSIARQLRVPQRSFQRGGSSRGFIVRFPPRVFSSRSNSN
ncbi:dynein axonemal light chain 1 isoform X2 [Euwallacea fornicatus]|uniref:dynein axonemal light chain 1 isoform X2 n=1 Tax=Euwallacea fornicatus TaxID=995702 RepID=UPI00338F9F40